MRIVCPHCSAAYNVSDEMLAGAARRVRCARCGHEWDARAHDERDDSVPEPAMAPEPAAVSASSEPSESGPPPARFSRPLPPDAPLTIQAPLVERLPRRGQQRAVRAGWGATALVLVAALVAVYVLRGPIQAAWPPSQRAYAALGLR